MSESSPAASSSTPGAPSESGVDVPSRAPGGPAEPWQPGRTADIVLYVAAAVSYVGLSIYNKWLLDWVVGPVWLVAWVWGVPALVRLARRQPVRPRNPWPGDSR